MEQQVMLAFQRAGTTTWVTIDPTTSEGQRALALFTHPKESTTMTTATGRVNTRPTTTVRDPETGETWTATDGTLTRSVVGTTVAKVRGFFRNIWASIKSGWAKVREALHLDTAAAKVRSAYRWTKAKVLSGLRLIGVSGGTGLGLLGVSTYTGRKAIGYALRPVGWALTMIGRAYCWIEETIDNEGKGGIRTWIADRMVAGREFLFGNADGNGGKQTGIVNQAITWVFKTFGRHLLVDSFAMRTARSVGTALVSQRLLSLGMTYYPGFFAIPFVGAALMIGAIALTLAPFSSEIHTGYSKVAGIVKTNAQHAEETVEETAEEVKATTAAAVALAAGNVPQTRVNRRARKATKTPAVAAS